MTITTAVNTNPLAKRIVSSMSWTLLGTFIARGLSLIALIFVARLLGVEEFGKFSILQSTIIMIGTFSGMGIGMTATKFVAEYRHSDSERAGRVIALCEVINFITGLIFSLVVFFLSPYLANHVLGDQSLEILLQISSVYLFFITLDSAQNGTIAGLEAFKPRAITQIITSIFFVIAILYFTFKWGITGSIIALIIQGFLNCLFNFFIIKVWSEKKGLKITFKGIQKEVKVLLKFAIPVFLSSLFIIPVEWGLNAILVNGENGYVETGYINATKQWFIIITIIPLALANITLPILSNLNGNKENHKYRNVVISNTFLMTFIGLFISLPIFIFSDFFISFYGNDFIEASFVLKLTCVYATLFCLNIIMGQIIWTNGMAKTGMVLSAFRSLLLVIAFLLFFDNTAIGLIWSQITSYVILSIVQIVIAVKVLQKLNKGK